MNAEKYYQSTLQNHLENIKESKKFYSWTEFSKLNIRIFRRDAAEIKPIQSQILCLMPYDSFNRTELN